MVEAAAAFDMTATTDHEPVTARAESKRGRWWPRSTAGHHVAHCGARLGPVKALRTLSAVLRPRFAGLTALTGSSVEPRIGTYVMAVIVRRNGILGIELRCSRNSDDRERAVSRRECSRFFGRWSRADTFAAHGRATPVVNVPAHGCS